MSREPATFEVEEWRGIRTVRVIPPWEPGRGYDSAQPQRSINVRGGMLWGTVTIAAGPTDTQIPVTLMPDEALRLAEELIRIAAAASR
jgi:hypothetical protein